MGEIQAIWEYLKKIQQNLYKISQIGDGTMPKGARGGSNNQGGNGNISKIQSFEKSIYKDDTEKSMIITANGEIIEFSGDESHVFGTK